MIAGLVLPTVLFAALGIALAPWTAFYARRPTPRLLLALVGASAVVVALSVTLAALGRLDRAGLLLGTTLVVTAALGGWLAWGRARAPSTEGLARPTPVGVVLGLLTLASYAGLVLVADLVAPIAWDTLAYHLAIVRQAAQTGTLEPFAYPIQQFHFPLVGELHSLWFVLLGNEESWRAVGLAQAPLALTAGVAVRASAEALGLRAARGWLVPAVMLTPAVLVQCLSGYVDLAFAAFVLAAIAFAIAAREDVDPRAVASCALASGLALGTKSSFLYYALPVVVVLASPALIARIAAEGRYGRRLLAWVACFLLGCGFWLGRGLIEYGNPFYPVAIEARGLSLFEGPIHLEVESTRREWFVDSPAGWLTYPLHETYRGKARISDDSGFGPAFAAAVLAFPLALVFAIGQRRASLLVALAAAPLTLLVWLVASPWAFPRYVLHLVGLAFLGLAVVVEAIEDRDGRWNPRVLVDAALVLALVFSVPATLSYLEEVPELIERRRDEGAPPEAIYRIRWGALGKAFDWLTETGGPDVTVTFTRGSFLAMLFGAHGENRVVYARLPLDHRVEGMPTAPTYAHWRRFLHEEGVDWVVVWHPWWGGEPPNAAERWIEAHPEAFESVRRFGSRASVWRPRFTDVELARLAGLSVLSVLEGPESWQRVGSRRAEVEVLPSGDDGFEVAYAFAAGEADAIELRREFPGAAWPASARYLVFDLGGRAPATTLRVTLEESPTVWGRFELALSTLHESGEEVALDLRAPQTLRGPFDVESARSLRLVLVESEEGAPTAGRIRFSGFRSSEALEPPVSSSRPPALP